MYTNQIPLLAYAFVGITTLVLSYITFLDKDDNSKASATASLPNIFGSKDAAPAQPAPVQPAPTAPAPAETPIAQPIVGGKRKSKNKQKKNKKTKKAKIKIM